MPMLVTPIGHGLFPAHAGAAQTTQNRKETLHSEVRHKLDGAAVGSCVDTVHAWQQARQCQCMLKQQFIKCRLIYWLMAVNTEV